MYRDHFGFAGFQVRFSFLSTAFRATPLTCLEHQGMFRVKGGCFGFVSKVLTLRILGSGFAGMLNMVVLQ